MKRSDIELTEIVLGLVGREVVAVGATTRTRRSSSAVDQFVLDVPENSNHEIEVLWLNQAIKGLAPGLAQRIGALQSSFRRKKARNPAIVIVGDP